VGSDRDSPDVGRAEKLSPAEAEVIEGWLAYGAALNEGRALHAGDLEFGQWLRSSNLKEGIHPAEQSAARSKPRERV
jgi:hypothetical protein